MVHLGHKPIISPFVHYSVPPEQPKSFEFNGEVFTGDDIVVVDNQIGNVEMVNTDTGYVALGFSLNYERMMARKPYLWSSAHRCRLDGIRHATDEEIALYDEDSDTVACAFEEADRRWKERLLNV